MKILGFLLLLPLLTSQISLAQSTETQVIPQKVTYVRTIPKSVESTLPQGGKSRFWGETKLRYEGKTVWALICDVQNPDFKKDADNVTGVQKCRLDLFVFPTSRHSKRISSVGFAYPRYGGYKRGGDFESTGLDQTWLDVKIQKRPVFIVKMQDPNGLMGMITQDVLVVFDAGLKNPVTQSQFGSGASNAADYNSWNTQFLMGEDSFLNIVYWEGSMNGTRETTYKWLNKSFQPFSRRRHSQDPDSDFENVPLTSD